MNDAFTPRNVAKFVAKTIVYSKTSDLTEEAMINYTRFEEDDLVVNLTSGAVGWYISDKLKPITDKMVDKAADFIVAKRSEFAAKKNNTDK